MNNQSGNMIIALFAGLLAGAALSVLLTPEKGSVIRRRLSDGARRSAEDLVHGFEEGAEALSEYSHRFSPFTRHIAHGGGSDKYRQNTDL